MARKLFVKRPDGEVEKFILTNPIPPAKLVEWDNDRFGGYSTRGLHGGGMVPVRKKMRTTPKKGRTLSGRRAHPNVVTDDS